MRRAAFFGLALVACRDRTPAAAPARDAGVDADKSVAIVDAAAEAAAPEAIAADDHFSLEAVPVGTWGTAPPGVSARVREWACPPVPKGADPGSLNDDQREGCGLVVELKASVKVIFDPNRWGPAYACRIVDPVVIEAVLGPDRTEGVCTLGVRRGAQWIKGTVVLSASEPTTFVLGGTSFGRALRVGIGKGSVLLAVPPPP